MSNNESEKSFSSSRINWYPGHMAKTKRLISENLNLIDVVYEVIDARIPSSSKINSFDVVSDPKKSAILSTYSDSDNSNKLHTSLNKLAVFLVVLFSFKYIFAISV